MKAIISCGNQQYQVTVGDTIRVNRLTNPVGSEITFNPLLALDEENVFYEKLPLVKAEIVKHYKGKKITIFKYKSKKNERRKQGFRHHYTLLKITSIAEAE